MFCVKFGLGHANSSQSPQFVQEIEGSAQLLNNNNNSEAVESDDNDAVTECARRRIAADCCGSETLQ